MSDMQAGFYILNGIMDLFYAILGSGKAFYTVSGCHYLLEQVTKLKLHVLNSDVYNYKSEKVQRKVSLSSNLVKFSTVSLVHSNFKKLKN